MASIGLHLGFITADKINLDVTAALVVIIATGLKLHTSGHRRRQQRVPCIQKFCANAQVGVALCRMAGMCCLLADWPGHLRAIRVICVAQDNRALPATPC